MPPSRTHLAARVALGSVVSVALLSVCGVASATGNASGGYSWGSNGNGELGIGSTVDRHSPGTFTLAPGVSPVSLAAGTHHALAIGSDGNLYGWGANFEGELGDGTTADHTSPELLTLAAGVTPTAVSAGNFGSLAIGSDGKVYAWGYNGDGEVGDGTTTNRLIPEAVALPDGVTPAAISAGGAHNVVIGSDGNLYVWGNDSVGQLGDGSTTNHLTPEVVTLAAGVTPVAINAGAGHTLAIGSDGKLYAWGENTNGQLGDGTTTNHLTPEVITLGASTTVTTFDAGRTHSLAVGSDGKLYAWGGNTNGQLGDGTTTDHHTPEAITLAPGVTPTVVGAGYFDSLVIGSDGKLYSWGMNTSGQVGDGTTTQRNSPVAIALDAGITPSSVALGAFFGLAIGSVTQAAPGLPESPIAVALPAAAVLVFCFGRRRRRVRG